MRVPPWQQIRTAVRTALEEDTALGDVTTSALFSKPVHAKATIIAEQPEGLIVAGLTVSLEVFSQVDPTLECASLLKDGDRGSKSAVQQKFAPPIEQVAFAGIFIRRNFKFIRGSHKVTAFFLNFT